MARPGVIVVHDEEAIVDLLRGLYEAHGYHVEARTSLDDAIARVSTSASAVVVTPWDRPIGSGLYSWVLEQRLDLRSRFVFVVDEISDDLATAAARGRVVPLADLDGLLAATRARLERLRPAARVPHLLLVEDDPDQRGAIAELLTEEGFDVHPVEGGHAAIACLERLAFDAVLSDWSMAEGSGAELHAWIARRRPELINALVFVTGGDLTGVRAEVGTVPVLAKGQDSPPLLAALRRARVEEWLAAGTPVHGMPPASEPFEQDVDLDEPDEPTLVDPQPGSSPSAWA